MKPGLFQTDSMWPETQVIPLSNKENARLEASRECCTQEGLDQAQARKKYQKWCQLTIKVSKILSSNSLTFDEFKIQSVQISISWKFDHSGVDGFDHQAKNAEMGLDIESVDCSWMGIDVDVDNDNDDNHVN